MAWSSSGGVAIRYVLPVLWMTSCLAVVGRMAMRELSVVARPGRSLMSMNALFTTAATL